MPSLYFSGFNSNEELALKKLLGQPGTANWSSVSEEHAQLIVIDLDSIYGHMIWLNARGQGRVCLGMSQGSKAETEFFARKPVTPEALSRVLSEIEAKLNQKTPILATSDRILKNTHEHPVVRAEEPQATPAARRSVFTASAAQPAAGGAMRLSDWINSDELAMMVRFTPSAMPAITLDRAHDQFYSGGKIDELLPYAQRPISPSDIQTIAAVPAAGSQSAYPLHRLAWILGYGLGEGILLADYSANDKYRLTHWPHIERRFPDHFKLATLLMRDALSLSELVEKSGIKQSEVCNFLNAGLSSGQIKTQSGAETGKLLRKLRRSSHAASTNQG